MHFYILLRTRMHIRRLRLMVRTAAFQAVNRGSIPLGATKLGSGTKVWISKKINELIFHGFLWKISSFIFLLIHTLVPDPTMSPHGFQTSSFTFKCGCCSCECNIVCMRCFTHNFFCTCMRCFNIL